MSQKEMLFSFAKKEECFDCAKYFDKKTMILSMRFLCIDKSLEVYVCKNCIAHEEKELINF
jgi:hypothetical protein